MMPDTWNVFADPSRNLRVMEFAALFTIAVNFS